METPSKLFSLAAAVLFFVATITFIFAVYRVGRGNLDEMNGKYVKSLFRTSSNWEGYAGKTVLGSDVRYLVAGNKAFYRVITKENPASFSVFEGILNPSSNEYVDPSDKFICTSILNKGGEVVGLQFTETGTRNSGLSASDLASRLRAKSIALHIEVEVREQCLGGIENELSAWEATGGGANNVLFSLFTENLQKSLLLTNLNSYAEKLRSRVGS